MENSKEEEKELSFFKEFGITGIIGSIIAMIPLLFVCCHMFFSFFGPDIYQSLDSPVPYEEITEERITDEKNKIAKWIPSCWFEFNSNKDIDKYTKTKASEMMKTALDNNDFAKVDLIINQIGLGSYTQEEIEDQRINYLISLNGEGVNEKITTLIPSPKHSKPAIGEEDNGYLEEVSSINNQIDYIFSKALMKKNETLINYLLLLYLDEPVLDKRKSTGFFGGTEDYIKKYSSERKDAAIKKYKETKKNWK